MRLACGLIDLFLFAAAVTAQTPRVVVLDILLENSVVYYYDVADPSKRGVEKGPTTVDMTKFGAFNQACQIDDIVEINGKPAKGIHFTCSYRMNFSATQEPGRAIGDAAFSNVWPNCNWELLSKDGRFVGRLTDGGFFPHSILGGAGAFYGARGEHHSTSLGVTTRGASVAEDPSMRRTHPGTGKYRVQYYLTPMFYPEVETAADGPSIFHADFTAVTAANPAKAGETLILRAKNLGPTTPYTMPGQPFAKWTSGQPLPEVNSDVEVTIGGQPADVILKAGWPGEVGVYRLDIRVPGGVQPGNAKLQVTAAWIPSEEVRIAMQ